MYDETRFIEWLRTEPPFSDWDEGYGNRMNDDARGLLAEMDALRAERDAYKANWESVPWKALIISHGPDDTPRVSEIFRADEVIRDWLMTTVLKEA
jgi:hypothetical protein